MKRMKRLSLIILIFIAVLAVIVGPIAAPCGTRVVAIGDGDVAKVDAPEHGALPDNLLLQLDAGYSAPHLHLEIRSPDYRTAYNPINLTDADWDSLALVGAYQLTPHGQLRAFVNNLRDLFPLSAAVVIWMATAMRGSRSCQVVMAFASGSRCYNQFCRADSHRHARNFSR